jgi:hypothetical protein
MGTILNIWGGDLHHPLLFLQHFLCKRWNSYTAMV